MGYITYKQADSRWGELNYNGSSTMATAGCGPTAVAMLGYAVAGRSNPKSCMKYMQKHGYAIRNQGTAWDGIPACMRACGLKDVKNVAKMSDVFAYLAKGYCAVFLTSYKYAKKNGASMDVVWTTDGHFISITDYKKKGGKDYVYVRDPGGRNNTGWFCYQTQLRGWLPQVWVGKVPGKSTPKPTPKPAPKTYPKCIDVSDHQGNINWTKVKAAGINYAIIKAGFGKNNIDSHFVKNISEATRAGVKVGVYWFSYAYTTEMAKKEAEYCINAIGKYKLDLPVFFDWEYDSMRYAKEKKVNPSMSLITSMHTAFCTKIVSAGFRAGFYYNYDYKKNHIDMDKLKSFYHWYALYDTSDVQTGCFAQQYTNKGKVDGITGNVDIDWIFGSPHPTQAKTTTEKKGYTGAFPDLSNLAPQLIAGKAKKLAWPYDTKESKYKYPSGSATQKFKDAIKKVYPNRSGWREQCQKGASCDVFVGTVVRASGHDTGFPRGLDDVGSHVKKKPALWKIVDKPTLKEGDVVEWGTSSAGHIFIYMGNNREAEANLNGKHYGHISKLYVPSKPKKYKAYRPIGGRKYLANGDSCEEVEKLQKYLNWDIKSGLTVDGDYGDKTEDAVRGFQKKYALTPDGIFGTASLMKAKAVKK